MNPYVMAATVISWPPQKGKAKYNNDYIWILLGKRCIRIVILRYEVMLSIEEMLVMDKKQRTKVGSPFESFLLVANGT